jgi:multidrug transporter EmrE-like cation transporter
MIVASVMIVIVLLFKWRKNKSVSGRDTVLSCDANTATHKTVLGAVIIILATLSGVLNGGANYLSLHLCSLVNASVLYPVLSGATGCATWLMGRLVFKEKLSILQTLGFVIGVVSVVLLNL